MSVHPNDIRDRVRAAFLAGLGVGLPGQPLRRAARRRVPVRAALTTMQHGGGAMNRRGFLGGVVAGLLGYTAPRALLEPSFASGGFVSRDLRIRIDPPCTTLELLERVRGAAYGVSPRWAIKALSVSPVWISVGRSEVPAQIGRAHV